MPPRATRTSRAPVHEQEQADADAHDVAAGPQRRDRERRQREPGRLGERRTLARDPEAVRAVADRGRCGRDGRVGRPAESRPARRGGRRPRTAIHSEVRRQDRPDHASREPEGVGQGIGQERRSDQEHGQPEDRGPGVADRDRHDRADRDGEGDPRQGRVHGEAGTSVRVGGRREDPERVERPVAQPCPADDVLDGDRPEGARIRGVGPVVAHQEELALGDRPRWPGPTARRRLRRSRRLPGRCRARSRAMPLM